MTRTTRTQRRTASARNADVLAQYERDRKAAAAGLIPRKKYTLAELKAIQDANGTTRKLAAMRRASAKAAAKDAAKKTKAPSKLTPEGYAAAGTEHAHQVAVFMWAAQEAPKEWRSALQFMFAIPNGGERNKAVAARLKAEGVKSGVPDIMLPVRKGRYAGLFIELKKPRAGKVRGGKATLEQNAWITVLNGLGYSAHVCEGCLAAIAVITVYMGLGPFETMADMGTNYYAGR